MAHDEGGSRSVRVVEMHSNDELRIEVGKKGPLRLCLRLLNGIADIFITKLIPQVWLTFPPAHKFAVYTKRGATIEMDGATKNEYIVDKVPFVAYECLHSFVDEERIERDESSQGPRTIVVGGEHCGKSTISRMLLSWATWPVLDRKPTMWTWMLGTVMMMRPSYPLRQSLDALLPPLLKAQFC